MIIELRAYAVLEHHCSACGDRRWPRVCGCPDAWVNDVAVNYIETRPVTDRWMPHIGFGFPARARPFADEIVGNFELGRVDR